jgi:hypothetical protein
MMRASHQRFGRIACNRSPVRNIPNNNSAGADYHIRTDLYSLPGDGANTKPCTRANLNTAGKVGSWTYVHPIGHNAVVVHRRTGIDDACCANSCTNIYATSGEHNRTFVD